MSEAQKSAMGPRRLFILLALGAVVFYFLSSGGETEVSEEEMSKTEELDGIDLAEETDNEGNNTSINSGRDTSDWSEEPEVRDRNYPGTKEEDDSHALDYDPNKDRPAEYDPSKRNK